MESVSNHRQPACAVYSAASLNIEQRSRPVQLPAFNLKITE
jgi:hypothetical protein